MSNYWVVGAMYSGRDDQAPKFIRRGYWKLGWSDADKPEMAKRRDQITRGDRIAIKRMMGQGSPNIRIIVLGVVREVDQEDGRVYVKWAADDLDRVVEGHGCFGTIHGPFLEEDEWVKKVFQL